MGERPSSSYDPESPPRIVSPWVQAVSIVVILSALLAGIY